MNNDERNSSERQEERREERRDAGLAFRASFGRADVSVDQNAPDKVIENKISESNNSGKIGGGGRFDKIDGASRLEQTCVENRVGEIGQLGGVGKISETNSVDNVRNISKIEPFAFVELERKTSDFLEKVRAEAQRIANETRAELLAVKKETEKTFQDKKSALDALSRELDERRRRLEADEKIFAERRAALERETFDKARADGFQEGIEAGKKEGARAANDAAVATIAASVEREVAEKTSAFSAAATEPMRALLREMTGVRQSLLKHWEENAMQIAAAIAYQTIMRDPATTRDVPLDLLREALELAMNCAALKIRMNPKDVQNLREPIRAILEETGALATAEVLADPKISAGGCVVESSLGVIDERLESRLERIVAELSE